jgi:hypothetical protein
MDHPLGWKAVPSVIALHRIEWPLRPPGSVVTPSLPSKPARYWCSKLKERLSFSIVKGICSAPADPRRWTASAPKAGHHYRWCQNGRRPRGKDQRKDHQHPRAMYGVHFRCSCSLIAKEELNIFFLGRSPDLEAEEKMWWGVGRGLESEMRSRDDLRRQARTLFPGQRRRRGEPTNE